MRTYLRIICAITAITCLHGCSQPQKSYLTIQLCLVDKEGVSQFLGVMREVAKAESLKFADGSAKTGVELKTIGADNYLKRNPALTINVGIEGDGGMGVTADNLGLPPYQVALGFTAGSDAIKAHQLSDRLVKALSQQWRVETVPQGQGVSPMSSCGG